MRVSVLAAVVVLAGGLSGALAQDVPPSALQDRPGLRSGAGVGILGVGGLITAIEGSNITLQTFRGDVAKVRVTPSTRLIKKGIPATLSDFKVGERIFAAGDQDVHGVWVARVLGERADARNGVMGGPQAKPEDNGKTYIFGRVTKIDETKLTVKKPDDTEQVIEVDDGTSFRNEHRESITLMDVKVGDFIRGQGEVKNGTFVPKQLSAGKPRGPRQGTSGAPPPDSAPRTPAQLPPDSGNENPGSEKK